MQVNKIIIFLFCLMPMVQPVFGAAPSRETPVVRAVRRVSPAVVNIGSEYEVRYRANPFTHFGGNPFFDSFFKDFFDNGIERSQKRTSLGSGVIIDGKKGFILTNSHVLAQTGTITVTLKDEREFTAKIVGADPDSDLAVLRIVSDKPLPSVKMGNSDDLMIGETVVAIGNPFGFSHTVTTGVISAVNRSIRAEDRVYHNFIQIDASINPGNSGGPLLNIHGDLIGINTAIYAKAQGIGFAIPIDTAKKIVSDLIKYGEVVPAWIGITVQNLDPELARYLDLKEKKGVLVKGIEPSSPARKAGIKNGDIIRSIDELWVSSVEDYGKVLRNYAQGDTLAIGLLRQGSAISLNVKASVFPEALGEELVYRLMGIKTENLTQRQAQQLGFPDAAGVRISEIREGSFLHHIGARPGDVIRQIDDITVENVDVLKKTVIKYRIKPSVVVLLFRGDQGYYITVKFPG